MRHASRFDHRGGSRDLRLRHWTAESGPSAAEATTLYTKYAFDVQPTLVPTVVFQASELEVAGLWENMCAQLFFVSGTTENGDPFRDCTILTHASQVFIPAGECSQGITPLKSGLVANGAFYFSWGSGSGISDSSSASSPATEISSPGSRAPFSSSTSIFNQWASLEQIGKLDDRGDTLEIVDAAGQPLASTLP
jgi:hypothetical protein